MSSIVIFVIATFILSLDLLLDSRSVFIFACAVCAYGYFLNLRAALFDWPAINYLKLTGASAGFFYFIGAIPVNIMIFNDHNYLAGYTWKAFRNYDVSALSAAALLVLVATVPLLFLSTRLQPRTISRLSTPEEFYNSAAPNLLAKTKFSMAAMVMTLLVIAIYLILTRNLSVDFNPVVAMGSRQNTTLYFMIVLGVPAATSILSYLIVDSMKLKKLPVGWIVAAAIFALTLFLMGRRPLLAGAIMAVVTTTFLLRWRIGATRLVTFTLIGAIVFMAVSVPFAQLRGAQSRTQVISGTSIFSTEAMLRNAASSREAVSNLNYATIMRFDLLGELAQSVSRIPLRNLRFGQGMLSQCAVAVPGFLWPGKSDYLRKEMLTDERIMEAANLPPTDVAGTSILYTYVDFGWLSPLGMILQLLLFMNATNIIITISRSYTVYLLGISSMITNIIQVDAFNFSQMIFSLDYFLIFSAAIMAFENIAYMVATGMIAPHKSKAMVSRRAPVRFR